MSYLPQGFTPDEEKEILSSVRNTEAIRTVMIAGAVAGFLFTLARMGELLHVRRLRKTDPKAYLKAISKEV